MAVRDTIAFLRFVLPAEGIYVGVVFHENRPRQFTARTIEELATKLVQADQAGHTAYHACATIKDARGVFNERRKKWELRCHANANEAKSLWADLDCGEGKAYATQEDAYNAVVGFCAAAGMPLPLYVNSGFGLHAYWPLERACGASEWTPLAEAFKAKCLEHGLRIDRSRATDISSILRPVGTHNRKHGREELVRSSESGEAIANRCAQLGKLRASGIRIESRADVLQPSSVRTPTNSKIPQPRRRRLYEGINSHSPGDEAPAYVEAIADRCAQLGKLRASGNIPEPLWHACAGICARCEDGQVKFHEWSSNGFPKYSASDAQEKLDRAGELTGPTTCAHFASLDPDTCAGCAFRGKVVSPLALGGRETAPAARGPVGPPAADGSVAPGVGTPTLPVLRHPYRWGNDGELLYVMEDKNGDVVNTKITAHPVFLNAVRTGELDDTFHCYTFSKYKPHEGWTTFTLDAGVVFSARGISEFAGKGVVIHDAKYWNDYLRHAVDDSRETGRRFDQFGWKHDHKAFLFGDMLYTAAGPVKAVGGKIIDERKALIGPRLGGSLHGWVQAINELKLFAKDMEPYAAQVLCGFGAPLMTFVSPAEGGCALHAWSPATSTGKTTGAQGAWTIWAQEHGLALTNRDTQVGQGMMLGTLSNLPVVFDEMESRDPDWVRQFLNMLSSGRDKLRGASGGEGLRVNRATWSTIMLSTSNRSLLEIVGASDGPDAPGKRVLELEMKMIPGLDRKRGEALRRQLEANAGWAGRCFPAVPRRAGRGRRHKDHDHDILREASPDPRRDDRRPVPHPPDRLRGGGRRHRQPP